ncbi:hypothetical protein O5559_28740, partial [Escherichia coli]|nr:hypothetical protein [Escherichia coli]
FMKLKNTLLASALLSATAFSVNAAIKRLFLIQIESCWKKPISLSTVQAVTRLVGGRRPSVLQRWGSGVIVT